MPANKMIWNDMMKQINGLVLYRGIRKDRLIKKLRMLGRAIVEDGDATTCCSAFLGGLMALSESLGLTGSVFQKYVAHLFLNDENLFSLACEREDTIESNSAYRLALREMECMRCLIDFDMENLCAEFGHEDVFLRYESISSAVQNAESGTTQRRAAATADKNPFLVKVLEADSAKNRLAVLMAHYTQKGCGVFADYAMFRYNGSFAAVRNADPVVFSDLIGCEPQKEALARNTEAFIGRRPANNMLLIGSRGTGKSSCVKALANEYYDKGLRLIEISKAQLAILPGILQELSIRGKRFVLYMDDLSFEDFETEYKHLKSLLEGGTENKPENVIFYATSNRRHIIREKWEDRNEKPESEEVHATDTLNEKLSLSDRFGITITFPKPSPEEYLRIVMGIAKKEGISMPEDLLKKKALQWELSQKAMSGRTARQFINHIKGDG